MFVDGDKTGTYDGIITVYTGYDDNAKIKRFIVNADGTPDDHFFTLNELRDMMKPEPYQTITVIFDDWLSGEIYIYGNYGPYWYKNGTTQGYA